MRHLQSLLAASLLGLGLLGGEGAQAATHTYQLSMDCADCAVAAGTSTYPVFAELTLKDYTLGAWLWADQLVSFVYRGSNLVAPYSLTPSGDDGDSTTTDYGFLDANGATGGVFTTGALSNPNGRNDLIIAFNIDWGNDTAFHFLTQADGSWSTCAPNALGGIVGGPCTIPFMTVSDYGGGATYQLAPVPEPEQALLLGAGLLLVGGMVRHRRGS